MHLSNSANVVAAHTHTSHRTPLRRAVTLIGAAALAILALGIGASPALAHDQLVGESVVTNTSDGAVTGVKLSFNNEILEVGSEIAVTDPEGKPAADGLPTVTGRDVVQNITQPTSAGTYSVEWRVVSSDGHPIQGVMALTIDADGTGTISTVGDGDHSDADAEDSEDSETTQEPGDSPAQANEEIRPISAEGDGSNVLLTTGLIVLAVIVAGAAALTIVIGSKRRRAAMDEAVQKARDENDEDRNQ